jgi:hypothetical protein
MGPLLLLATGLLADENNAQGVINGSLTNGTTGETLPGVEIILKKYEGGQEKDDQKILSDPSGQFYFSGLHQYMVHHN